MTTAATIQRVCPVQVHPLSFYKHLNWIDGRPLLEVMESYRQKIHREALFTFRADGSPQYRRVLCGRGKKNSKTTDLVVACLYKCLVWKAAGHKGNQCYLVATDLQQANDALDLCKKLIATNAILARELEIYRNVVRRLDGQGFIEILPAGDATGLHGKTFLFYGHSELHTQRDYRVIEALELDRTRPDAMQWFESYAPVSPTPGIPLVDLLSQHRAKSDPRLLVSWFSGSIEEANPSLNGPLGPTMEDILDAQRSLPSWVFRRLYQNLPGQPDGAALDAAAVQACVVPGRDRLSPKPDTTYSAFVDMSGGGSDDSTLAIGHVEDGIAIVDLVLDQGSRTAGSIFSPQATVKKFADVLSRYGCHSVTGDKYAGHWPATEFSKQEISYRVSDRTRSELYAALEPKLNSGAVELVDSPKLIGQLIGLIRKGERVDHANNEHDDFANSIAGVVWMLTRGEPLRLANAEVPDQRTQQEIHNEVVEAERHAAIESVNAALKSQGVFWPNEGGGRVKEISLDWYWLSQHRS